MVRSTASVLLVNSSNRSTESLNPTMAISPVGPATACVSRMPVLRICGISGSIRELVSTTTKSDIGSPPRLKCVMACSTPLSVIRKSLASSVCTISPVASRTVTGVFTRILRSLMVESGGASWIVVPGVGVIGPAGACPSAAVASNKAPIIAPACLTSDLRRGARVSAGAKAAGCRS